ncbi:MAG: insulinase family protein [Eubacteriaceae bacterium]|nr:insulinase family protein [Eubacteriaceae bacterium]
MFEVNKTYYGFILERIWPMKELASTAHLFSHEKSGARLLYLENNDDNMVFCATYRTPPVDDCGTPHIMEHSVLGGSEKYPLKEPFVELIKSSLNTFLNAMTYPDKTMYPVASKNEKDFENLISVYCDGLFRPGILKSKHTFFQEGWHYHLENEDEPITINGVVYNEMKGAFSSPLEVLQRNIQLSLYPDTPYAFESGGDPDAIPELSYEKFVELYNMYYHPSNSYLYLYGDMDPLKHMEFLDREYLCHYDKIIPSSDIPLQKPFENPNHIEISYSYDNEEDMDDKYYFALNYKIGETTDSMLCYAFNVLVNILFESDASVLKKALIDAELGDEVMQSYATHIREPYFSIIIKNAKKEDFPRFVKTVEETLENIVREGIDRQLIHASINSYEFELREADSGSYPLGLIYLIDIMESWLYDEEPGKHLLYEKFIKELRENETSEYYVELIKKYLLGNTHRSTILLSPEIGLNERKEEELEKKLAEYKASLSDDEIKALVDQTNDLIKFQSTPDSEEAKATVPFVSVDEIQTGKKKPDFHIDTHKTGNIYTYTANARGIAYASIYFPLEVYSEEEISAANLLTKVLATYETENYSELMLSSKISEHLGGLNVGLYNGSFMDGSGYMTKLVFNAKALVSNMDKLTELGEEVLLRTKLDDEKRLLKTITEEVSRFESAVTSSAHYLALSRLSAFESGAGAFSHYLSGIGYYRYIVKIKKELEEGNCRVLEDLRKICQRAVTSKDADVLIICDNENKEVVERHMKAMLENIPDSSSDKGIILSALQPMKEAIIIPAKVNYVGLGANYRNLGHDYPIHLPVLKKYLTGGYLWENIRVLGGAYGAMLSVDRLGAFNFVSYRDPNMKKTLEVYRNLPSHLNSLELSKDDVDKLIIGTISDIDSPVPIYTTGRKLLYQIYKKTSFENEQYYRDSLLSATLKSLKESAEMISDVIENASLSVIGTESMIREAENEFDVIKTINELR